ncbi:MAG: flagellar biosynthetic protein FliR [Hyphomicrobium sp.]|nr:flagellar biosynthetic protein FliR [Hyphomicrobium sp.]
MTPEFQVWITVALLALARVSALFAVLPVFAAARVPATIRAYVAIALSLSITPTLYDAVYASAEKISQIELLGLLIAEVGIGLYFGFMVRVFFLAVAFTSEFISQQVGFMGMFVASVTEGEMTTPLADLISLFSAALFFAMEMHLYLIRGVFTSYEVLPIATSVDITSLIEALAERISTVFVWSLQLGAPFILYVTVCNLLLGLANRLVPQVPVQFVMAPGVLFGGLALALLTLPVAMERLTTHFTIGAFGL